MSDASVARSRKEAFDKVWNLWNLHMPACPKPSVIRCGPPRPTEWTHPSQAKESAPMNRREFLRKSAVTGAGSSLARGSWGRALAQGLPESPDEVGRAKCLWGAFAEPPGQQKAPVALAALG